MDVRWQLNDLRKIVAGGYPRGLAFVLGALLLPAACAKERVENFEGEVDTTATLDSGALETVRYFIKGERVRVEATTGKISATQIIDISTNDIFILDDARKTYRTANDPPTVLAVRRRVFDGSQKRITTSDVARTFRTKEPATLFEVPGAYTLVK